jgi:hypothetical protein
MARFDYDVIIIGSGAVALVNKGRHFAAFEEPELFSEEIRTALRPLRKGRES